MNGFDILLTCAALTVYHEARGEPYESQFAVASVVVNRAIRDHQGDTCAAAFASSQFSWTAEGYDRKLKRVTALGTPADARAWEASLRVAKDAFYRRSMPNLYHYHTSSSRPGWAARVAPVVARYGEHVFYGE